MATYLEDAETVAAISPIERCPNCVGDLAGEYCETLLFIAVNIAGFVIAFSFA